MPVVSFDAYVTMLFNPTTTYIELLQGFNMFACIFVVAQRTAQNQLSTSSEDRSKPAQRTTQNQPRGPLKTSSEDRSKPAQHWLRGPLKTSSTCYRLSLIAATVLALVTINCASVLPTVAISTLLWLQIGNCVCDRCAKAQA